MSEHLDLGALGQLLSRQFSQPVPNFQIEPAKPQSNLAKNIYMVVQDLLERTGIVLLGRSWTAHHSVSFLAFLTATLEEATDIPLGSLLSSKGWPRFPRMPTELTSRGSKST